LNELFIKVGAIFPFEFLTRRGSNLADAAQKLSLHIRSSSAYEYQRDMESAFVTYPYVHAKIGWKQSPMIDPYEWEDQIFGTEMRINCKLLFI
jgi:hypothetical protein